MGGRKRVRARCVRMPKASMQRVHVSIYSFPPLSPPFSQVLLSFHQHRKKAIITHQYIHSRSDHTKHKTFTQSLQAKSRKEDSKHSNHASHTITDKRGSHTSSRRERRCTALSRSQTRTRLQSRQPQRGKGSGTHWARGGPREDGVRTARGAPKAPRPKALAQGGQLTGERRDCRLVCRGCVDFYSPDCRGAGLRPLLRLKLRR